MYSNAILILELRVRLANSCQITECLLEKLFFLPYEIITGPWGILFAFLGFRFLREQERQRWFIILIQF